MVSVASLDGYEGTHGSKKFSGPPGHGRTRDGSESKGGVRSFWEGSRRGSPLTFFHLRASRAMSLRQAFALEAARRRDLLEGFKKIHWRWWGNLTQIDAHAFLDSGSLYFTELQRKKPEGRLCLKEFSLGGVRGYISCPDLQAVLWRMIWSLCTV